MPLASFAPRALSVPEQVSFHATVRLGGPSDPEYADTLPDGIAPILVEPRVDDGASTGPKGTKGYDTEMWFAGSGAQASSAGHGHARPVRPAIDATFARHEQRPTRRMSFIGSPWLGVVFDLAVIGAAFAAALGLAWVVAGHTLRALLADHAVVTTLVALGWFGAILGFYGLMRSRWMRGRPA